MDVSDVILGIISALNEEAEKDPFIGKIYNPIRKTIGKIGDDTRVIIQKGIDIADDIWTPIFDFLKEGGGIVLVLFLIYVFKK